MHSPMHPARIAIMDFLEENKDKYTITKVQAFNHYPKDPTNPGDNRVYDKKIGGALLDLGVYTIQQNDQIAHFLGTDIKTVLANADSKDIRIKQYADDGVDLETVTKIKHNGVSYETSSKVNPSTDTNEDFIIWLKDKDNGKVSKLALSKGCHPQDSIGVFLENEDGSVLKLENSYDTKSSYAYQLEMVQGLS